MVGSQVATYCSSSVSLSNQNINSSQFSNFNSQLLASVCSLFLNCINVLSSFYNLALRELNAPALPSSLHSLLLLLLPWSLCPSLYCHMLSLDPYLQSCIYCFAIHFASLPHAACFPHVKVSLPAVSSLKNCSSAHNSLEDSVKSFLCRFRLWCKF